MHILYMLTSDMTAYVEIEADIQEEISNLQKYL